MKDEEWEEVTLPDDIEVGVPYRITILNGVVSVRRMDHEKTVEDVLEAIQRCLDGLYFLEENVK